MSLGATSRSVARRPTVSVVVPMYNEEAVIGRCLDALAAQTEAPHEVIVVDNRSTDRGPQLVYAAQLRHPGLVIRLLEQHAEQGLVPTRDAGFDAATGDVLGRIDADTVVGEHWVERVADAMLDTTTDAISGPVAYWDMPFVEAGGRIDDLVRRAVCTLGRDYRFLFGSNMALRASAWRLIRTEVCRDRLDRLHEDIDLSVHLFDAGLSVRYVPRMRAAISARRLESPPAEYRDYVHRFRRTYASHGVGSRLHLRAPEYVFLAIHPPLRRWRAMTAFGAPNELEARRMRRVVLDELRGIRVRRRRVS
jgi:glycosyltransferase involved in cell wall biosynthesis